MSEKADGLTEVGQRLKELREERGVRPERVALDLEMSAGNYNHYETGRQRLKADHLPVIAATLGVPLEYLVIRLFAPEQLRAARRSPKAATASAAEQPRTIPDGSDKVQQGETDVEAPDDSFNAKTEACSSVSESIRLRPSAPERRNELVTA